MPRPCTPAFAIKAARPPLPTCPRYPTRKTAPRTRWLFWWLSTNSSTTTPHHHPQQKLPQNAVRHPNSRRPTAPESSPKSGVLPIAPPRNWELSLAKMSGIAAGRGGVEVGAGALRVDVPLLRLSATRWEAVPGAERDSVRGRKAGTMPGKISALRKFRWAEVLTGQRGRAGCPEASGQPARHAFWESVVRFRERVGRCSRYRGRSSRLRRIGARRR
jgi:hypothetical protein